VWGISNRLYFDGSAPKYLICVSNGTNHVVLPLGVVLNTFNLSPTLIKPTSSQRAEYVALIYALSTIEDYEQYEVIGDCENVILQMNKINKVKGEMKYFHNTAQQLINTRGLNVIFKYVPRDENPAGRELDRR
jgi:ribonuclease HI